jgi:prepilin-type N-terminal cleavage/methylation domain-containing protein
VRKRRGAFSLFEILLVIAIVVILAALAYPSLNGWVTGGKGLTGKPGQVGALDEVRGKLADARARAMEEGRPYRFAVMPGKGNYRIAPDDDESWGQGGGAEGGSGRKPLVFAGALPPGSLFSDPHAVTPATDSHTALPPEQVSPGSYQTLVTFLADGTARDNGQIAVSTVGAPRAVVLTIQALTGNVTTQ